MGLIGGIDGGGTTFKCVIADEHGNLLAGERFAVTTADETLAACVNFFKKGAKHGDLAIERLGIGCFGPLNLDPASLTYGALLETPKEGWSHVGIRSFFSQQLSLPVSIDTDVNAALAGEMRWGAGRGLNSAAYVTIGTGIGAGIFANGHFIGKPAHPEFGHISVDRHKDDNYDGLCVFHSDCLEGMASAKALATRFGSTKNMAQEHHGWDIEAWYLAQACQSLFLSFRPQRIILGGGLMLADHLLERVRTAFVARINGYLGMDAEQATDLIMRPGLGDDAGVLGAVSLAINQFSTK